MEAADVRKHQKEETSRGRKGTEVPYGLGCHMRFPTAISLPILLPPFLARLLSLSERPLRYAATRVCLAISRPDDYLQMVRAPGGERHTRVCARVPFGRAVHVTEVAPSRPRCQVQARREGKGFIRKRRRAKWGVMKITRWILEPQDKIVMRRRAFCLVLVSDDCPGSGRWPVGYERGFVTGVTAHMARSNERRKARWTCYNNALHPFEQTSRGGESEGVGK